jgi:hypothetical protein
MIPFALLICLLISGCKKEELPDSENAAALQAVSGFYAGTLTWARVNPTTGEESRGVDAQALVEVRPSGPDQVTFYLTTSALLGNPSFASKLISKVESGSGNTYAGEFIFETGEAGLPTSGAFGYYNRTLISLGQRSTLRLINFTRPSILSDEAILLEAVKR